MEPIVEGIEEGLHKIELGEGNKYFGQINKTTKKPHGQGIWTPASGTAMFQGQFKDGKFDGLARIIYGSGHFEGKFADGKKSGPGKFIL